MFDEQPLKKENSKRKKKKIPKGLEYVTDEQKMDIKRKIEDANRIIFFLGAGCSVASKIPTFRGKFGLWNFGMDLVKITCLIILVLVVLSIFVVTMPITIPLIIFLCCFLCCAPILPLVGLFCVGTPKGWQSRCCYSCVWTVFKNFFYDTIEKALPNDGHNFIKFLEDQYPGKEIVVITQNVDALEEKCGFQGKIHQLHGNYYNFFCMNCNKKLPYLFKGKKLPKKAPKCPSCNKRTIRTGCLLFGDDENPFDFPFRNAIIDLAKMEEDDLFFIVGTSATVYPAAEYPHKVCSYLVEVNITNQPSFNFQGNKKKKFTYIQAPQDQFFKEIEKMIENDEID